MPDRSRRSTEVVAVVVVGVILVGGLLAGLAGTTEVARGSSVDVVIGSPESGFDPEVVSTRAAGGFSLFGIRLTGRSHYVVVRIAVEGMECAELLATDESWPAPHEPCASPVPIEGEIAGLGILPDGDSLVLVEVEVDEDCHDVVELGDPWPLESPLCTTGT